MSDLAKLIWRPLLASCVAVDYSRHAANYDSVRADDAFDRQFWLPSLVDIGGIRTGERILDLGAGTGRFAKLFASTNPVVACDASRAMLRVAQRKGPFDLVQGDAHRLPFRPDSFDVTILVMVLHQLVDYPAALRDMARVAHRVVVSTVDMATRRAGILEEAFPSLLDIDRKRFPKVSAVVAALEAVGFREIREEVRPYHRSFTPEQQMDRVRKRYVSTFDLLPGDEYERGLRFLETELLRRHPDRFDVDASFTFLAGTR